MDVPEDWQFRKRGAASVDAVTDTSREPGQRTVRTLKPDELEKYARTARMRHVNVSSHVLCSMGSDTVSVCKRILHLLPADNTQYENEEQPGNSDEMLPAGSKRKTSESCRCDMSLELDTLLSRLPYKRMMHDMLPHSPKRSLPSVPYVTRIYEERFMREAMHPNERECVMRSSCECMFIDSQQPFVGVEFVLPGEDVTEVPQMCVLCSRASTQQLFYDIIFDNSTFTGLIQRYGNLHSVPNEYAKNVMLICPPNGPVHCMPLPIVSHQRNRYSVNRVAGVHYLRQHGVYFQ
jgi:hypothetical protein